MEDGVPNLQSNICNVFCLQEDVIESAKLANAHGFITALPDGYDTKVCIPAMREWCLQAFVALAFEKKNVWHLNFFCKMRSTMSQ